MSKTQFIHFNGILIEAKITATKLEKDHLKSSYHKKSQRHNTFRTNSGRIIFKLAKAYGIRPKIDKDYEQYRLINGENADFIITVELTEIGLKTSAYAGSRNRAFRILALKVHRCYQDLIIFK